MSTDNKVKTILEVCAALSVDDTAQAREIILSKYLHDKNLQKVERAKQNFNQIPRQIST